VGECQELLKQSVQSGQVREVRQVLSAIYSTTRDFSRAEEQLQLILRTEPHDPGANNDLGYLWADQGKNLAEAERMIRKAIDLDREQRQRSSPGGIEDNRDNAAYLDSLGWVRFRRGDVHEAKG